MIVIVVKKSQSKGRGFHVIEHLGTDTDLKIEIEKSRLDIYKYVYSRQYMLVQILTLYYVECI